MSRPLVDWRTASKDSYNKFIELNSELELSFDSFKEIIFKYNELLIKHILETGDIIKMPFGLGEFTVNKYKPYRGDLKCKNGKIKSNLPINWKESKAQRKTIYHLNSHSEGYKFHWMWNYWKSKIKYAFIWSFKATRVNSRLLAKYVKDTSKNYQNIYKEQPRKK